jgi:hypothetical protein
MHFWACQTSGEGLNLKGYDTMTAEDDLIRNGWKKRAIYDDPRLTEMMELYEKIGLEVHLEPIHHKNKDGCAICMQQHPDRFRIVYTRKKSGDD